MITSPIPRYSIRQHLDVKIPMRDGVNLSAELFLPDAPSPFPILLTRTPYGNNDPKRLLFKKWMVERGFGFVFQDCRGRYDSEGIWEPFRNEREDGWDTLDWISKQPFCNGNIGMTGGSYEGYTSWVEAPDAHPSLKAIAPIVPLPDPVINVPYQDGAFFWNMIVWSLFVHGKTNQNLSFIQWPDLYQFRPLRHMIKEVGISDSTTWENWMDHPVLDSWWKEVGYMHRWNECSIPVLHVAGWYDDDGIATYKNFPGMRENAKTEKAREEQRLIIGPWSHKLNQSTQCGEIDFGPQALINLNQDLLYFFAHHLANEEHSDEYKAMHPYKCKLFIMGENRWYHIQDWPIPEVTRLFLQSNGKANTLLGDGKLAWTPPEEKGGMDQFEYDPQNPVPYITDPVSLQLGEAWDQQAIERRPDVLVYTTSPLEEDLVVCGRVFLHLFFSSSSSGTDFTGKLVDVYPNGKAIQICDGIKRAEFRNSLESAEWLEKGVIYEIHIDMWATGIRFLKGHCIRLEVSSSACPKFYPHTNTNELQSEAIQTVVAKQIIYHESEKESYLELSIIPESVFQDQ